jgi:hypothetical protein
MHCRRAVPTASKIAEVAYPLRKVAACLLPDVDLTSGERVGLCRVEKADGAHYVIGMGECVTRNAVDLIDPGHPDFCLHVGIGICDASWSRLC